MWSNQRPFAGIGHREHDSAAELFPAQCHRAAGRREAERVFEQVRERLEDAVPVDLHLRHIHGDVHDQFDTNLLALHPEHGRAANWQRALLAADDRTQFALATYADREALELARARFDAVPELVRGAASRRAVS